MKGVYLVTDRTYLSVRSLDEVIIQAAQAGVSAVQLREKGVSTRFFLEEARRVKTLLAPYKIPLIINDRIDIALAVEADGVHVGQDDLPYPLARKLLGKKAIIGLSVETMEQVIEAEDYDVDYLGVSAIFTTPTKTDTKQVWGLEGLREARKKSRHILVAIGGINVYNAADVIKAGADGIAVVSAICSASNPQQATQELCRIIQGQIKK